MTSPGLAGLQAGVDRGAGVQEGSEGLLQQVRARGREGWTRGCGESPGSEAAGHERSRGLGGDPGEERSGVGVALCSATDSGARGWQSLCGLLPRTGRVPSEPPAPWAQPGAPRVATSETEIQDPAGDQATQGCQGTRAELGRKGTRG